MFGKFLIVTFVATLALSVTLAQEEEHITSVPIFHGHDRPVHPKFFFGGNPWGSPIQFPTFPPFAFTLPPWLANLLNPATTAMPIVEATTAAPEVTTVSTATTS